MHKINPKKTNSCCFPYSGGSGSSFHDSRSVVGQCRDDDKSLRFVPKLSSCPSNLPTQLPFSANPTNSKHTFRPYRKAQDATLSESPPPLISSLVAVVVAAH